MRSCLSAIEDSSALIVGQFTSPEEQTSVVQILLVVCGVIAIVAFASLFFLTGRSKRRMESEVHQLVDELSDLVAQSQDRLRHLDSLIIDHLRALGPAAHQSYDVLKQTVNAMEQRAIDVRRLMGTGDFDDLLHAREILESPIENTGDHLSSVLFSSTILTLKPDQFAVALDLMYDTVVKDLSQPKTGDPKPSPIAQAPRKRRFTIRGFMRSLTGK